MPDANVGAGLMEGYHRYKGEVEYVDGNLGAEDPEGTVGTAVQEFTFDVAVVDGRNTPELVRYRMDYETRKRSLYGTSNEVTKGFIRVGSSEVMLAIGRSSQEVFDIVCADAVYRQDKAWASALPGVPGLSER